MNRPEHEANATAGATLLLCGFLTSAIYLLTSAILWGAFIVAASDCMTKL